MRWLAAAGLAATLSACTSADLAEHQADPLTVAERGAPNWALAAPPEVQTAAAPTHQAPVFGTGPEELLGYLDAVAMADARVERLEPAWAKGDAARAYVQRSATFGFPDVISVRAIDLGAGDAGQRAAIVIYSQSVYGYSDLGVNGERVARWLAALAERAPLVPGREVASK